MTLSLCISPVTDWQPESGCTLLLWPVTVGTSASCNPELNKWLSGWWMEGFTFAFLPSMSKSPGTETGKLPLPGLQSQRRACLQEFLAWAVAQNWAFCGEFFFLLLLFRKVAQDSLYSELHCTICHFDFLTNWQQSLLTTIPSCFLHTAVHALACFSKKPSLFGALSFFF